MLLKSPTPSFGHILAKLALKSLILNFKILFFVPILGFSQYVQPNEELIFSFETTKGKKMAIVKDKNNAYIQYRYGKKDKIELVFPPTKNEESWELFNYNTLQKNLEGQTENIEIENLSFQHKQYEYLIYRTNFADEGKETTGIIVKKNGKGWRIDGRPTSIQGSLKQLQETSKLQKKHISLRF